MPSLVQPAHLRVRVVGIGAGGTGGLQGDKTSLGCCVLQADSPEDMHSWIRAITGAVQALKTRPRVGHIPSASCLVPNEDCANVRDTYSVDGVSARVPASRRRSLPSLCSLPWKSENRPLNRTGTIPALH